MLDVGRGELALGLGGEDVLALNLQVHLLAENLHLRRRVQPQAHLVTLHRHHHQPHPAQLRALVDRETEGGLRRFAGGRLGNLQIQAEVVRAQPQRFRRLYAQSCAVRRINAHQL